MTIRLNMMENFVRNFIAQNFHFSSNSERHQLSCLINICMHGLKQY